MSGSDNTSGEQVQVHSVLACRVTAIAFDAVAIAILCLGIYVYWLAYETLDDYFLSGLPMVLVAPWGIACVATPCFAMGLNQGKDKVRNVREVIQLYGSVFGILCL